MYIYYNSLIYVYSVWSKIFVFILWELIINGKVIIGINFV